MAHVEPRSAVDLRSAADAVVKPAELPARPDRAAVRRVVPAKVVRLLRARPYLLAALTLCGVCVVWFAPVLTAGHVLLPFDFVYLLDPVYAEAAPAGLGGHALNVTMGWDRVFQFHPWLVHNVRALRAGEFPLWNPASVGGTPHLALDQTAVLDPLSTGTGLLFGAVYAGTMRAILSVVIAATGMMLLLRRRDLPSSAALLAAIAFAFGGWFTLWLGRPMTAAAAWLPWTLWGIDRWCERGGGSRDFALVAGFVALSFLAGHVETTAHLLLLAVAYAAWRAGAEMRSRGWRLALPRLGGAVGALLTGAALAAVVLVPLGVFLFGEAGGPGVRGTGDATLVGRLLAGMLGDADLGRTMWTLVTAFVPVLNPAGALPYATPSPNLAENTLYVGVVPLVIAAYGLASGTVARAERRFWLGVGLVALLVALRAPIVNLVAELPLVHLTAVGRLRVMFALAAAVLAGHGLATIHRGARVPRSPLLAGAVVCLVGAFITAAYLGDASPLASRRAIAGWGAGVLCLLALGYAPRRMLSAVVVMLCVAELYVGLHGVQPDTPPRELYPETGTVEFLQRRPEARIAGFAIDGRRPFVGATSLVHGLESVEGYNVLYTSRYRRLIEEINRDARWHSTYPPDYLVLDDPGDRLVDLLGVRYVVTARNLPAPVVATSGIGEQFPRVAFVSPAAMVRENPDPLPRAFPAHEVIPVRDRESAATMLTRPAFDPRRHAVVEARPQAPIGPRAWDAAGTVRVDRLSSGEIELRTTAADSSFVVLTEAFARGWRAMVDDRPTTIYPTDLAFMGVALPPGRHRVRFSYRPWAFRIGLAISVVTLMGLLGAVLVGRARRPDPELRP